MVVDDFDMEVIRFTLSAVKKLTYDLNMLQKLRRDAVQDS